ncbi:hypothetical protein SB782_38555, partial [Brevibacillus sp. SIMBA_076]|uniref:hypothetical protein n=1 Tax=Brevibacillus sp. SIMBA_076 TaxID=3085814 RepID=UPI00397CFE4F
RQNRQVNELLTKAEQSFRQLAFAAAYQLAEDARLVVEGAPVEEESAWLLRRKKKGLMSTHVLSHLFNRYGDCAYAT